MDVCMAAQAAPPAPEFCLLWIPHWSLCMTKADWSGWMQGIGAVLAVAIAIWLPWRSARTARKRSRLGHLMTIATDVRIADRQASVYLNAKDRFKVPAYRVPLYGANTALPWLLAEGDLTTAQSTALVQWYIDATSFNYSLDIAQHLKNERGGPVETPRTENKANHLIQGGRLSRFDNAIKALRQLGLSEDSLARIPAGVNLDDDET